MRKKLLILVLIVGLLAGGSVIAWHAFDMPPIRLVLKYGYPSPMGPTGRTLRIEGVEFVEISPGYFRMGSHYLCDRGDLLGRMCATVGLPWGRQPVHDSNECPPCWIGLDRGFWIARTEITIRQYRRFPAARVREGEDLSEDFPIAGVNKLEAMQYCGWLADRSRLPVRLPAEAEWECACRAGSHGHYCYGDDPAELPRNAWVALYDTDAPRPVACKKANPWGLYDLHGNVWEWCLGALSDTCRDADPECPSGIDLDHPNQVIRGGSWLTNPSACRSARRGSDPLLLRRKDLGFRPAFVPTPGADD